MSSGLGRTSLNQPNKAFIIGSGEDVPLFAPQISDDTLVICADGGVHHAQRWGIVPHIVLGDFDSLETDITDWCQENDAEVIQFPIHKDKTDGELAVEVALERGVKKIAMTGVWGSRIDHSLANLDILCKLALQGVGGELLTSAAHLYTATDRIELNVERGDTISLLALSDKCEGVTVSGLYYPLENGTLIKGATLGISNKATAERINITCSAGVLLVVHQKK